MSRTVTNCFNDLDLSRAGFEPGPYVCGAKALGLDHHGGPQIQEVP